MSQRERTGKRDLLYSRWHRSASTRRFLGAMRAARLCMIDLDAVEYCHGCSTPVVLIEVKHHMASAPSMRVTKVLAEMCGLPAYLVRYWPNPNGDDIATFAVRNRSGDVREMSPSAYANWLWSLRSTHHCKAVEAA